MLAGARLAGSLLGLPCSQLGGWKHFTSHTHLPPQKWASSINEDSKTSLLAWEKETGVKLVQINGQRRYGGPPPGWVGPPPPVGTEVYIGKLPQDLYEDVLIPLFQSVGKLYEFRLMMTFSGLNRGFAYARYSNYRGARNAIATFNNYEVRQGWAIMVCRSTQKRELSVDGLDTSVSQRDLEAILQRATQGVLSVTLHTSPHQEQAKLAVLKYSTHQTATLAKKALMQGNLRLRGSEIKVEWLHSDLKQKLQLSEETPPSSQVQEDKSLAVPKPLAPPPAAENAVDQLNTLCRRQRLGTPVFFTKCLQANPNGWLLFQYQVVIPGYPMPVSGFTWVRQDGQGQSRHEEAKAAVAPHVLHVLGSQLM
ncbi:dead end protein homolog 1 [Myiozetetes cayanensis]|uniref:dead end protein homolog 1 n=1 Tax=Myiozetetes cayanensis TaxID=478635 RepID=UPI00215E44DD|nr:dead end protein homolog 1 [Myiozetetes cayanensis]